MNFSLTVGIGSGPVVSVPVRWYRHRYRYRSGTGAGAGAGTGGKIKSSKVKDVVTNITCLNRPILVHYLQYDISAAPPA